MTKLTKDGPTPGLAKRRRIIGKGRGPRDSAFCCF